MTNRKPYDPTRRNRNIGTKKQGHGQNNKLVIPEGWDTDRVFYENLSNPVITSPKIHGHTILFFVEPPLTGFQHACTINDVEVILSNIEVSLLEQLDLIVFRQPPRKQRAINPVWGRLAYFCQLGKYSGTAIYLESQEPGSVLRYRLSQTPDDAKEMERLRQDGHAIARTKRHYEITLSSDSIRTTQLYRTLLHEFGHLLDWLHNEFFPAAEGKTDDEIARIMALYDSKPSKDKEAYAHSIATFYWNKLENKGVIPFPRIIDPNKMSEDNLPIDWFLSVD